METVPEKDYILLPLWTQDLLFLSSSKDSPGDGFKPSGEEQKKDAKDLRNEDNEVLSIGEPIVNQEKDANVNSTNNINTVTLQVTQKDDGIFISQDKYVDEILKKLGFSTMKTASTPMETSKPLLKDKNAEDVDVHLNRSIIGLLMYLTSLRSDSPFDLEAYTDSDYADASLDRNPTTGSCQFLWIRLISLQCKKQTVVANSPTEAELCTNDDWNEVQ
nr:hypothetical protein [Tanacetum cinerariifolium]